MSSKDMLGPLTRALVGVHVRMHGLLLDIANRLGSADSENFFNDLAKFVREWKKKVVEVVIEPLLESFSTSIVLVTTEPFVANLKFKLKKDGGICSYLSGNFKEWFLGDDGKVEQPITKTTLHGYKLNRNSLDAPIIKEQGGEAKAETLLTEVFSLMGKQPNGPNSLEGVLLTNGWANIFYVRDKNAVGRAVDVTWSVDGWSVYAYEVSSPSPWSAGSQVFSRNSVLESSVSQVAVAS